MKLRDNEALVDEVQEIILGRIGRQWAIGLEVLKILDAVERHQQAALPAVGGATQPREPGCQCDKEIGDSPCRVHGEEEGPPPPVSGSPQVGEGRPKSKIVHARSVVAGLTRCGRSGCRISDNPDAVTCSVCLRMLGRPSSSPPVDPSEGDLHTFEIHSGAFNEIFVDGRSATGETVEEWKSRVLGEPAPVDQEKP